MISSVNFVCKIIKFLLKSKDIFAKKFNKKFVVILGINILYLSLIYENYRLD